MTAQRPATAFVRRSEVEQQPRPRLKAPVKLRDFEIDHRYFTEERGGTAQKAPAKPLWLMQGGEEQWGLLRSDLIAAGTPERGWERFPRPLFAGCLTRNGHF